MAGVLKTCGTVGLRSLHRGLFHSSHVHSVGTSPLLYGLAMRRRRKAFAVEFGFIIGPVSPGCRPTSYNECNATRLRSRPKGALGRARARHGGDVMVWWRAACPNPSPHHPDG
eukprot:scaffold5653_cov136-Isochrysis_galbana.AAC.3